MAVDQCCPAQARGRRVSCSRSALDQYQLTRSHPLFSPMSAPKADVAGCTPLASVAAGRPGARGSGTRCRSRCCRSRPSGRGSSRGRRYCSPKRRMSIFQRSIGGSRRRSTPPRPGRAAGAGDPVCAEAGRDEEAGDVALAQDELTVRGERLGPVDEVRDLGVGQAGDERRRRLGQGQEPVPVGGRRVLLKWKGCFRRRTTRGVLLVAADHEPPTSSRK